MSKSDEQRILELFLRARHITGCAVEPRERPDFLLKLASRFVGVEITQLVQAERAQTTVPQQWASESERLLRATREVFESHYGEPVVVQLAFRAELTARDFRVSSLAADLAAVVKDQLERQSAPGLLATDVFETNPHPVVATLYAIRSAGSSESYWTLGGVSSVQSATCEDVILTVGAKESLVGAYRAAAPEIWLLIDCDLVGQGNSVVVPGLPCRVATEFDAVFCIDFYANIREVACVRAG